MPSRPQPTHPSGPAPVTQRHTIDRHRLGFGLRCEMIAETDVAAAHGALYTGSGDLASLAGRPATTLSAAVGAALRVLGTGIGRH